MECFDKLRQFYEFHQQIERNDQILHEIKAIDRTPASMTIEFHKPNGNIRKYICNWNLLNFKYVTNSKMSWHFLIST